MTGGSRIIPIDGGGAEASGVEGSHARIDGRAKAAPTLDMSIDDMGDGGIVHGGMIGDDAPALPVARSPYIAVIAVLGWTGFFLWANLASFRAGITPAEGAQFVATWSMPVLLALVGLLLVLRTSARETRRFNDAARTLAAESAQLEARLSSVNTELALARDFIAAQSRDLEALGRVAVDRLSGSADRLQDLIEGNGA